jgi:hypothetical protein
MSLYDDASLILYPSGYKEDKIYSLKPTDGSGDLTFTRASSATRVNEQGLIETASVLGSELIVNGDFATNLDSWSTSSWWVWNSLGAYHPSTSSHKPLYQQCCVIGKTYLITFDLNCVGSSQAKFSLGSSLGVTTQVIGTSLTTGSYSYYVTAAAEYIVFNRQNTAEYYVNNVSVKEVITLNVPRIDYTGGGCAKLLLEPQRSNIITYSEQIDNAAWNKTNVTITANAITSPIASFNADAIVENSASNVVFGVHPASRPSGLTLGTTYSVSFFAKKVTRDFCYYDDFNAFQSPRVLVFFNLATGTVGTAYGGVLNPKMENYGNGWYRCSFQFVASSTLIDYRIGSATTDNTLTYTGVIGQQAISVTACQFETGTYITSYIPTTSGTAVTRVKDAASKTGISSLINSTEGVLYAEISALADDLTYRILSISDGTTAERIYIQYTNVTNTVAVVIKNGSTTQANMGYALSDETELAKVAIKYKANDFALWVNGFEVGTDASGTTPTGLSELAFDDGGGANYFYGNVQNLMVFPSALSDTELATLTTL